MSSESKPGEPDDLSVRARIPRVQELWDEIARLPKSVEPTPAQLEEAERRPHGHEANPGHCSSWNDIKRRLEGEL